MGLLDDLSNLQPTELGGTGKTFIDADTLRDEKDPNRKYRIQGVNAGEVEKVIDGKYKLGTAGGQVATDVTHKLANSQGFTNVVPLLNEDGTEQTDQFGRVLIDLKDENGRSFKSELLKAGAFDINTFTNKEDVLAGDLAEAKRRSQKSTGDYTPNAFDIAAAQIQEAELAEGQNQRGFKQTAIDEVERMRLIQQFGEEAVSKYYDLNRVQVGHKGRDLDNRSLNPFSDSWDQGWTGVGEAAFGVANLLGERTGLDGLAQWGEDGVAKQQAALGEYGTTILDYKEVDGFSSAIQYLGNNLALSLPQMGITAAATLAAPFTAGTSLAVPAAIYTGQTWNEMEEVEGGKGKSATIAIGAGIAQATLDKLGLNFIFKKGVGGQKLLNRAVDELVKKGMPRKAAEAQVASASRKQIAEFAGNVADIAKEQIAAKQVFKQLGGRSLIGAAGEGLTEAGQEATAYLAAVHGSDKEFDWHDLNNRLISAAVAGASLGGGLSVPSTVYDTGAWVDVAYRQAPADAAKASAGEKYAAMEKAQHGRVASIEELAADAKTRSGQLPGVTIDQRTEAHNSRQVGRSTVDKLTEEALNVSQLWQGATRNIFTPALQEQSRAARVLADMFGGNLQRIFSGSNFESSKHHRVATYKNMVADPRTFYENWTGSGRTFASQKNQISDTVYSTLNAAVNKDGQFDPELVPANTPNRAAIQQLGRELKQLGDRMHADQVKHNPELGYIKNYLFKYKALDKGSVNKNRVQFQNLLQSEYKYSPAEARKLVDEIIDNPEVADIDQAFSVVKGGISPASHKKRTLNMSENQKFQEFFEKDMFANVSQAVKSAARYTAHRDYIGENGAVVNKLLDDMQAEGVPQATVDKVAAQLKNYLDAESGNYKRPTSDLGKSAQRLQKNFMMFTTLAGLPLATISSFVETMLINKGLRKDQIFGKSGSLESTGKELANTLWSGAKTLGTGSFGKEAGQPFETNSKQLLKDLGYYEWDVGAATVTGVSEVNAWQQWVYEEFFKWTGLSGFTNFTRAARAGIAQDYINDKAEVIFQQRHGGQPRTREIQEAEEGLRNLGIDVDQYVETYQTKLAGLELTPKQEQFMADTTREATFNFVNEAIALPQSANRPLIYQDPRFALFTQFQGFIATFTANHIPKLWGEYVKRGTPAMKYNAFALATTMIMMGFVSQHLKDLIKYGGTTPHLDNPEYIQRGIRASGLLGTSERVLDQFFPIYEQRTDGVGDWAFKTGSGESPALSTAARAAKSAGKFIEGDAERGLYYGLKSAPGFGPFTSINQLLASGLTGGGWNYKGDK